MSVNMSGEPNRIPVLYRAILIALLAQAVSFFLFSTALWLPVNGRFTELYEPLSHNPWTTENGNQSQVRHRILGPVIAYYLGMRGVSSAVIPVLGGTMMLFFSYLVIRRISNDQWATWTTFLIATTQTLISSQTWFGFQDALAGAAVAACLLARRSWLGAVFLLVGMLAEERCAAAIPFIIIWHFDNGQPGRWKRGLLWAIWLSAAVASWVLFYFYVRSHFLPVEQMMKHDLGGASFRLLINNASVLPLGFFQSIRGGWIIIGYALYLMFQRKNYLVSLGCILGIAAGLIQAGMVADISRSASVIWPMLIIGIRELIRQPLDRVIIILKVAVLLNVLSPCYQVISQVVQYYYPLPFSLARWLLGF